MIFELATNDDLNQIVSMYKNIVAKMNSNGIQIWNEYYPFEFFKEDIKENRFYILKDGEDILASCALCEDNEAKNKVDWSNINAKAIYIDRLGVNTDFQGKGYGSLLIKNVIDYAKANCFDVVRLFVVDVNMPAMKLYEKNCFVKLNEMYDEVINENLTLKEYVYEYEI